MRKKKVEGEYQIDSWPKGPEWSLCPLARPDIAMGPESQIEAWSARNSGRLKTPGSHHQFASCVRRKTTASNAATTDHCLRDDHPAERRRGLGCQGQRHRGEGRNTLDIPLHRRDLWGLQSALSNPTPQIPRLASLARNDRETARSRACFFLVCHPARGSEVTPILSSRLRTRRVRAEGSMGVAVSALQSGPTDSSTRFARSE